MVHALFAALTVLAQAAPPAAPPAAAPPAAQAPNDVSGVTVTGSKKPTLDPKEVICHSEMPIGSRFPQKICASRQDIAERRQIDRMEIRRWTALRPGSGN